MIIVNKGDGNLEPSGFSLLKLMMFILPLISLVLVGAKSGEHQDKLRVQKLEITTLTQKVERTEAETFRANEYYKNLLNNKEATDQQLQEALKKIQQKEQEVQNLKSQVQAKADSQQPKNTAYAAKLEPKPVSVTGNKLEWLKASSIPQSEWALVDWLVTRESSWNPKAQNPKSTAYGLKHFLNSTWAGVGCVKSSDPVYQLNCGHKYVMARYGSWQAAKAFWAAHHWY